MFPRRLEYPVPHLRRKGGESRAATLLLDPVMLVVILIQRIFRRWSVPFVAEGSSIRRGPAGYSSVLRLFAAPRGRLIRPAGPRHAGATCHGPGRFCPPYFLQ
ncbi:hypothetical protein PVAP13_1NG110244 [Panicum virgatum]|uniref:Uncharacterized protein n=1 Tax=Panicum virgatum TaxID=38727 RepID=A0A8T0WQU5_PANVG|nr:hypothetical protein PVAP13_1NG110244 [Panicum virgatum]